MGVFTSASLIYGMHYSQIPEEFKDEVNNMLDDGGLDSASPYYDSPMDEWYVGVEVNINGMTPEEAKLTLDDAWEEIPRVLKDSGAIALYVSAHVT